MDSTRIVVQGALLLLLVVMTCLGAGSQGKNILVGDSEGWRAGTNYTQWAIKNSPFHINDTLVFKFPAAAGAGNSTVGESVYLLPNLWSFITCEFRGGKLLGNASEGVGEGLKVQLNHFKPYYFASPQGNAYDCIAGLSKFIVVPSSPSPSPSPSPSFI